ncbi:Conserved_hypothetical protein [Hexamita inflata]|uniref:Uncharacterized protein n=1 Tax=Hexamita inflata TaxID=28002 RepID=A0AA86NGD9_9EUKA|nr:Conserved hypothetical protein [Hexamita inflata]
MLFIAIIAAEAWPKKISTRKFTHTLPADFTTAYVEELTLHKDTVYKFISQMKKFHPSLFIPTTTACTSDECTKFVEIMGLFANDFNLYQAYIETVMDSMLAFHNDKKESTMLGYSLTVNANYPHAAEVYKFIQEAHVEYISDAANNKYSALSVAGYQGFFVMKHSNQAIGFTADYKNAPELPLYVEAEFVHKLQHAYELTIGSQLLAFTNQKTQANLLAFVQTAVYPEEYLLAFVDFGAKQADFFQSKKGEYQRKDEKSVNQVQSSCRANLENINASDFRIVQMERALNKLKAGCNLDSFYSQLRSFPFRTTYSAIMNAYAAEAEIDFQQKCQSIVDGKEVVNCADPPVPNNWWAIVLSCLLMAATMTVWVFGCIYAKRYEGYEQTAAI